MKNKNKRVVYERIARLRNQLNRVEHREPSLEEFNAIFPLKSPNRNTLSDRRWDPPHFPVMNVSLPNFFGNIMAIAPYSR